MANKKLINCDQLQTAVEKVKEYVDTKDATKSDSSHVHGNITNTGGLSGKSAVVVTDANGLITSSSTISTTELDALDGVSSNIQTQLDGKASSGHAHGNVSNTGTLGTASAVVVTDANKKITTSSTITTTELGYLDGVTSGIQNQLNNKASSGHVHGDISNTGTLPNASTVVIADANKKITNSTITTTELGYLSGVSSNIQTQLGNKAGSSHTHGNISNGGALSGKSMAVITDANGLITTSSTISTTELGYLDNVTSNVQTQLNSKAASSHTHGNLTNAGALGTANAVAITDGNKLLTASTSITTTELGYLDGVTSNIQTQLDNKSGSTHTHGNITNDGKLGTASMVVISDANKNITTSSTISTTELGYLNGVSSNVQDQLNAKAPTSHASTATTYGVSSASNYGHAMASSTTPKAHGTAAVGSETAKFARGDHVHPAQTSVTGNAGTSDKWKTARKLTWTGDVTGEMTLDGSADKEASLTLAASGVTAGSYGPSANASPAHAGTFSVPYVTVDAKGRVTAASTKTITLPGDNDYRVKNELKTTTKAYITGTTSATTATGTQVFDTGVYLTTTAGEIAATKFTGELNGNANTASRLSPGKKINETEFDGSSDITTAKWGTSRTLTIGNKGQSVDGSQGVSWSLSDIGALPSAGGTATGNITVSATGARFKATNGTNTVWFGLNSTGDRWGLYDETNAKYIVESTNSGSSFLGNATSATQATKADQLTNNRTINGTNFNGTANITTTNWGTARNITIGDTVKSVNGSANYSWTLNEIGAAKGKTTSATTAATAGWYRIATSVAGINRNMGIFTIDATVSGKHSITILSAGICYGQAPSLVQLSHAEHSATGISQARIVYHTTYSGNYAYLEVYVPTATATTINVHMADYFGWSLVAPSTAGSVPSGYTNKALTLVKGGMAADKATFGAITSGNITTTGNIAFENNKGITFKTAADYTNTNASTTVAKGTAMTLISYNNGGNFHIGSGLYDNYLNTGNVYLSSPNHLYLRTVNSGKVLTQINGSNIITAEADKVTVSKPITASAGITSGGSITSDTSITDNLGSSSIPWSNVYAKTMNLRANASGTNYGYLQASTAGTATTNGMTALVLGNNIASGNDNNAFGRISMYGTNTGCTQINPGNDTTSNITLTLPSAGGIIARTVDNVESATKVHTKLATTTKAYLLGTSTTPTSTSTAVNTIGDTGVYLTTTSGQLHANSLEVTGNITTTANGSHNIGATDKTFNSIIGKNVHSYLGGTHYASLRAVTEGTTSAQGVGRLVAGNNTNAGTAGNAKGQVLLYGTNTGYTALDPGNNTTSNTTLTLPSATGTLISSNQATFTTMPKFNMNDRNGSIFEIFGGDENGHGVRFGGGGCTFIGSGESAANIITAESTSATDEQLYVTSDNNIYFYTKCGTIADRRKATLNGSLNFYPDKATTGSIGHADYPWLQMFADTYHVYGSAGKTYGHLNAQTVGTTSVVGETRLVLGNSTAEGTADNSWGRICLYTKGSTYTYIQPGTNTAAVTLTLPTSSGTLATTANIDSKVADYLPLAGGTMTGNITLNNNIVIKSKTAAAYTNTNSSASVAAGTAVNILQYNDAGNLHIGSGLYDNYLNTGSVYIASPNHMYLRTRNDGSHNFQINGTSVVSFSTSEAAFAKNVYAKAGVKTGGNIVSDTALTDNIGADAIPFNYTRSRYFQVYGEASKQYGNLRAETIGTTSTVGQTILTLGNSTASGTASNAQGEINFYSSGTGYAKLKNRTALSSNVTIQLPSASGQLPIMVTDSADYWGILPPSGAASSWLRSPQSGLIPYEKNSEVSSLGTSSWPWYNVCGKNFMMYDKNGQSYGYLRVDTDGTANTQGEARLTLGNNISSGAAKNSCGKIALYGTNTGYTMITPGNNSTSSIILTLPSSGGTLARTADKTAGWSTARTLTIGATGKSVDGTGNVSWSMQEIMKGQGLNYDTACNTLYFNNAGTTYKGRVSVYNNGTEDFLQLGLCTADTRVNTLQLYPSKTTIAKTLYIQEGSVQLNASHAETYYAFDAHRNCSSATDSSSGTYYPVSSYEYSTARFGCVNSFGGCAAIETRHNGTTVGYIRALPTGGIQIGSGKKLHIQASAPTSNVATGDVWIDI